MISTRTSRLSTHRERWPDEAEEEKCPRALSAGEQWRVRRKRLRLDKHEMAERVGVPYPRYCDMEKSNIMPIGGAEMEISEREWYIVLRRRAELTQTQLGKLIGVAKLSILKMEQGQQYDITKLRTFWRTFPWEIRQ